MHLKSALSMNMNTSRIRLFRQTMLEVEQSVSFVMRVKIVLNECRASGFVYENFQL